METIVEDDVIAEIPVASSTKEQAKTSRCLESFRPHSLVLKQQPAAESNACKRDRLRGLRALRFLAWRGELGLVSAIVVYFATAVIVAYLPKDSDRRGRDDRDRGDRNLDHDL